MKELFFLYVMRHVKTTSRGFLDEPSSQTTPSSSSLTSAAAATGNTVNDPWSVAVAFAFERPCNVRFQAQGRRRGQQRGAQGLARSLKGHSVRPSNRERPPLLLVKVARQRKRE